MRRSVLFFHKILKSNNTGIAKHNRFLALFVSILLQMSPVIAFGQSYSSDGNRWYEVEISIFTNQSLGMLNAETAIPEQTVLTYPDKMVELKSNYSSLSIEFANPDLDVKNAPSPDLLQDNSIESMMERNVELEFALTDLNLDSENSSENEPTKANVGPEYSPGTKDFRLINSEFDPFIRLNTNFHKFTKPNQQIANSPEHRLLYHSVWRQPMISKKLSSAIFIKGGEQYGMHSELEGSLTLSYNINRIDIDANLWRHSFTDAVNAEGWLLPPPPFLNNSATEMSLVVENVAHMLETRAMISNTIHYLDHPALGMLVEVRPYLLPGSEE